MFRRRGPGLVRAAATTAVVVGTAGAVRNRQDQKYAAKEQAAEDEQQAAYDQGVAAAQQAAAPGGAGPAGPAGLCRRAREARPAQGPGAHLGRGLRGQEETGPRDLAGHERGVARWPPRHQCCPASSPAPSGRHFEALTKIPRPSRHEEPVIEHVRAWAADHGFELQQDTGRNLVIHVPASEGREQAPDAHPPGAPRHGVRARPVEPERPGRGTDRARPRRRLAEGRRDDARRRRRRRDRGDDGARRGRRRWRTARSSCS